MLDQIVAGEHWFSALRSKTKLNIFFFPYAGSGTLIFRTWQEHLPPDVGCYLVHLPGREQRLHELPFCRVGPLVQELKEAISQCLDVPFVFFGYCMGALIGFELARELRRSNLPLPLHLFVATHAAPQIKDLPPPMHNLSDPDLLGKIHTYAELPREALLQREIVQVILPLLRADFAVCEMYDYLPEPPLGCSISAFGGIEDSYVAYEDLAAWREQTSASFTLRVFPGGHFFLRSSEEQLLQALREDIAMVVESHHL